MPSAVPHAAGPRGLPRAAAGAGGSAAEGKKAGSSVGAVQLVSYWVPGSWDRPRDLGTPGRAETEEREEQLVLKHTSSFGIRGV